MAATYVSILIASLSYVAAVSILPFSDIRDLCMQLEHVRCDHHYVPSSEERTCGTDGVTYPDFCHYAKARCVDSALGIAHVGPCPGSTHSSSPIMEINSSSGLIQQVFCDPNLSHQCSPDLPLDPFCGSDGNFYLNKCEFAKAVCRNPNLVDQPLEHCKTNSTTVQLTSKTKRSDNSALLLYKHHNSDSVSINKLSRMREVVSPAC